MSQITINNPTQLSFKHDKLRAESVTIIPTPNNSSDLATMINDTTYYSISNDSECRYKKVITPKTNVERTNYYKEDGKPVGAKVCHYVKNETDYYVIDNGVKTVNFNNGNVMFQNSTISDDEIFFKKDSEDNQIKLYVVNSTSGIELENRPTKTSFSFNVPSFVSKVEIEHKMEASLQDAPDKAKIHIDLNDDNMTYYIAEKRSNTTDGQTSVTVLTNIYGKNLKNVMSTAGESNELLKVDLGNGYIYFCNSSGGDIYRAYWDNTVGEKHIYSFTKDDGSGYTIKSFEESLGGNYEFLMKLSELEGKISDIGYEDEQTLEATQDTSLDFNMNGSITVGSGYYAEDKSNYPGLYTLYNDFEKDKNAGYFFLEGTNHIFKINISSDDERMEKTHTLNETDIKNGLEVFTGGTFNKDGLTIDDTYTSQLNFGTLCDELSKSITSSNILSSSNTVSSDNS